MNDLKILFPAVTSLQVGGRLVRLRPIEFRHFDACPGLMHMDTSIGDDSPEEDFDHHDNPFP